MSRPGSAEETKTYSLVLFIRLFTIGLQIPCQAFSTIISPMNSYGLLPVP